MINTYLQVKYLIIGLKRPELSLMMCGIAFVLLLFTTTIFTGLTLVYANSIANTSTPLTDKQEFDVIVNGISHKSILVSVSIDGKNQKYIIHGNPRYVSAPTVQQIVFKFARDTGATPPSPLPIKLGDIWVACITLASNQIQSSCSALPVTSLTQPQKQIVDARYIPGQESVPRPAALAPLG
jgi:hypothetical protein